MPTHPARLVLALGLSALAACSLAAETWRDNGAPVVETGTIEVAFTGEDRPERVTRRMVVPVEKAECRRVEFTYEGYGELRVEPRPFRPAIRRVGYEEWLWRHGLIREDAGVTFVQLPPGEYEVADAFGGEPPSRSQVPEYCPTSRSRRSPSLSDSTSRS